ncbi:hypothetical protein OAD84_03415 [Pelagibacterales bacterium]|nr:hypothetical protein [Pelagibacterales bacterium]
MIIIDWISPNNHRNFNRAFFTALKDLDITHIVFSEQLVIPEVKCIFQQSSSSRLGRAIHVLKLIWFYRKSHIILLTYDHLFLPFTLPFFLNLAVFEHNTTPEKNSWLKAFWHKFLLVKVTRLAQFSGQYERLKELLLDVHYVGSPIQLIDNAKLKRAVSRDYVAPTISNNLNIILDKSKFFQGNNFFVKNNSYELDEFSIKGIQFKVVSRIDIDNYPLKGIIVTTNSEIRGSGWFNDAIARNIPVIILDKKTEKIFTDTFPGYPFYREDELSRLEDHHIAQNSQLNMAYIVAHNKKFNNRFLRAIN